MLTFDPKAGQMPNDQDASGRNFGAEEIAALDEVLASGTLTSTKGTFVKRLEAEFAKKIGAKHAIACSSGTAAIHAAIAAIDLEPGDEVVTTPVTDMGALAPILFQTGIPVFADVDPLTLNVTAETLEAKISPRTKALVVTHLFGNPAEMDAIVALAKRTGLPLIEDCAQAFMATYDGTFVGRFGAIGCFSLQQGKHITCGEGGIAVTDDDRLARLIRLFVNKSWGYGDPNPDHYALGLNYRMSELQGAVAFAQLGKLDEHVEIRKDVARELTAAIADIPGIAVTPVSPKAEHTYWKYCIHIDETVYPGGPAAFAPLLQAGNIACVPRYIQKPAFACEIFQKRRTFGNSQFPFSLARPEAITYEAADYPGTYSGLAQVLVFPLNEKYTPDHALRVAAAIRHAAENLTGALA
jgi:dTDP-4-amino-4,6-dideoxygalactose transaminase